MNGFDLLIDLLSWALILAGSAFLLIGAIGTLRFPDFWSRLHAVSVTDSAGMILLVLGMILQAGLTLVTVKLVLIGVFLFVTGPTATHAVANAALVSGFLPEGLSRPALPKRKAVRKKSPAKKTKATTKTRTRTASKTRKGGTG
ncbi:MAG: monovalent cation/H(+) antiporter subunit G [Rhizobiaceae bacterium]|nr:monovalent cation/H(+) antiporter subunit G [Rhizobiaceae bacterium]